MRFQVPQFIEVEDKIFGPFTLKQFIYMAGAAGIAFVFYVVINNLFISILPILLVLGLGAALAFYRVNNKPLVEIAEYAFKYWFGGKLYIWKKEENPKPTTTAAALEDAKKYASVTVPKISDSKLKDLAWSLDIKESIYSNQNQR